MTCHAIPRPLRPHISHPSGLSYLPTASDRLQLFIGNQRASYIASSWPPISSHGLHDNPYPSSSWTPYCSFTFPRPPWQFKSLILMDSLLFLHLLTASMITHIPHTHRLPILFLHLSTAFMITHPSSSWTPFCSFTFPRPPWKPIYNPYNHNPWPPYVKGTVSRDFLLLFFSWISFPPALRVSH
jgi:hypothetical protein